MPANKPSLSLSSLTDGWLNAAASGDIEQLTHALSLGASCAWVNPRGQQAIHLALIHGNNALASLLIGVHLASASSLTHPTNQGQTPLGTAIASQNEEMVRLLLAAGVKADNPVASLDVGPVNAWHYAAWIGSIPVLRVLRKVCPALMETCLPDGQNAFHIATSRNHEAAVHWLLKKVTGQDVKSNDGLMPWHRCPTPEMLLTWESAVENDLLMRPDENGSTLAHHAVHRASLPLLNAIISLDASCGFSKNNAGEFPLALALEGGFWEGVDAFVQASGGWFIDDDSERKIMFLLEKISQGVPGLGREKVLLWRSQALQSRLTQQIPVSSASAISRRL